MMKKISTKILWHICTQIGVQPKRKIALSAQMNFKVTVIGASGGIGSCLSFLLKSNCLVRELALYDVVNTPGLAKELSHIDTNSNVTGYLKDSELPDALKYTDVVVILAGMRYKPGIIECDALKFNAAFIMDMTNKISKSCPKALIAIITNPVNILVPIAAEVLRKNGVYDARRLFGVTALNEARSRAIIGKVLKVDPRKVNIPVIGGHSSATIIPVISQCNPKYTVPEPSIQYLTKYIQDCDGEIIKAKGNNGSVNLSMAYATERFINSLLLGLLGETNVTECAFVESGVSSAKFFASSFLLGAQGIQKNLGLPKLSAFEHQLMCYAVGLIQKDIETGVIIARDIFHSKRF